MMLTDAGSSMVKLGKTLGEKGYFKTLHVLCMAHAMHNVAGTIQKCYPEVNKVIMGVKELFSKSHARLSTFYKTAPGTNRPPAPVVTRFGTWLDATLYYANPQNRENLLKALKAIESKSRQKKTNAEEPNDEEPNDEEPYVEIDEHQAADRKGTLLRSMIVKLSDAAVVGQIVYVAENFHIISEFIKKVEKAVMQTRDFLEELKVLRNHIEQIPDLKPEISSHFQRVLFRNTGFNAIATYFDSK